ncbi:H-type lectin domain protein (macronuclear) [Tetrahymena thermophila SB210]|uniref:H-type lectin domain protein n=1 Tax=Tetrahymena thermophila (strain SB210) TaxID=312017 RepID=W7XHA6_TETTS|nr:H-type lectin domain protein [Tetrahymena thermophila SB210]EWS76583.1 H-type lectin domain protein [Tetrahymena thermophila SB210]|eukprot:XP_012650869.1 H-type lectin domain protein [Tetrahymena thermophila SB210]
MKKILILSIILNLLLQQTFTQKYIQSSSSQSGLIEFAHYYGTTYCDQVDQTAYLSNNFSQQFNSVPQIFVGIIFFDLDTTTLRNAFRFTVKSVDQNQVSIQLNKYGLTCIFGIQIQYFAIVDQDVQIQNYILTFNQLSDIQTQTNKQYQFKIPQKLGYQRGVQCAITGFDSTYQTPPDIDVSYSHRNLSTTTQVDSSNNFYQIQIQAVDLSVNLKIIYINCIEYYIGQAGDYSMINNIQQVQTTQQITTNQNFQINLDSSFTGNTITSYLGLQQFDMSQKYALRFEYQNFNFQSNQQSFQVKTWGTSILYSSTALFFQHQMIDCFSSLSLINSNDLKQCVSKCQDGQYAANFQTTQVCSPCNPVCKTCSSLNVCTSCQSNQFVDPSTQSCSSCDTNCLTCQNSSTQCLSCPQGLFLYNQKCYSIQPQGTYCDQNKICQDCQRSYQCNFCDNTLQICISCINQSLYFLNGVCSNIQPPNTYCNLQKICQKCPDSCNGCDLNLNCTQCANPQNYFYFGKCLQQQPQNTYCSVNFGIQKFCQNCHPACSQCFGQQLDQCSVCQQGYQLVGSSCLCQQGYGYSTVSQQCEACQVSGCIQCSLSLNQCEVCQEQFLLDQTTGKCYCSNPQQYYSTELQQCFQNNIHFCKVSSKFQNTCEQCLDGYYNFNKLLCSYCGKSKYTDSQNQCNNDCQPQCIICSNKSTCLLFQDEVNSNTNGNLPINPNQNICHYSCGLCNGSEQSNCLTCSSQTRIYDIQQQTCNCKSGRLDNGDAECQAAFDFQQNYLWILQTIFL